MHLQSLEVSGFKSFAKKASLAFTTPITGIVGPNGSGKSNVAEAFRFVLGEQSIKSMRGKRTEDLIWNGSHSATRANRASVKLTFDNTPQKRGGTQGGRLFDLDFDAVTVERIIHRDSSSEYILNGTSVRLKDIVELLSGAHIGSSGHHIISQGEADRVLSVNPRELKSMIEDALGLKIYHYKKEESLRKLEKTGENIEKIEGLRREIKPHLAYLQKQVDKLEKARELRDTLKAAYREYFVREKAYIADTTEHLSKEEKPLVERAKHLESELHTAQKTLAALERADAKTEEVLALERNLKTIQDEKDVVATTIARIEGELEALRRQKEREERRANIMEEKHIPASQIMPYVAEIEKEMARAEAGNISLWDEIRTTILGALRSLKHVLASEGQSVLEEALKEIREATEALSKRKKEAVEERTDIEKREQEARKRYQKLQEEIDADRTSSRDAERAVFSISNESVTVRAELERIQGVRTALRLEEEELKRDLGEAGVLIGRDALEPMNLPAGVREEVRRIQKDRKRDIERMKIRLEDSGIALADDVMKEYKEVEERDVFLERELLDLRGSAETLTKLIAELDETLAREFGVGLTKINTQFTEFFALMFGGGTAALDLVKQEVRRRRAVPEDDEIPEEVPEEEENLAEGIEISINLPRKKIKSLEMLSGGERALTSIALIFAMSQVNPPPFIILDETDAALDEANSRRYGDMIENLARHTQLILITHNRETMSRAGALYGVTMGADAVSQLLSVSFATAVEVAK